MHVLIQWCVFFSCSLGWHMLENLLFCRSSQPAGPASWKPIRRLCHQTIQPLPFTSVPHGVIDLKICQDWTFHVDTFFSSHGVVVVFFFSSSCETDQFHSSLSTADTPWKGELHYRASNRPPKELYQLQHPILDLGKLKLEKTHAQCCHLIFYAISNKNQQNSSFKSPSHFGYLFFDV